MDKAIKILTLVALCLFIVMTVTTIVSNRKTVKVKFVDGNDNDTKETKDE